MERFKDQVAVVTGSAGGIGGAVASALAAEGAKVAGLDRQRGGGQALDLICDLGDDDSVAAAAKQIGDVLGVPSIVIHAAAMGETGTAADTPTALYQAIYNVNVVGAVRLLHAFSPGMQSRGSGCFVFVSSINAAFATPGLAAYAASKAALDSLVKTAALELAPAGVRVNSVRPASIDTPLLQRGFIRSEDPAAARARNVQRHPLGRLGTVDDVTRLILFLASDEAGWITGAHYSVDGGAGVTRR